jgi:nicotinate-nucleotide adenylyltransferase
MEIGLYFGSFNPIHHGHLIIANFMIQQSELRQVWFVVSPQNPLKPSGSLLNEYNRFYLVQLAIEGDKNMRAVDIEFKLPRPSYTVDTLAYLKEKYPDNKFSIIMGGDSYSNLSKWKNPEYILKNHIIYVYRRLGNSKTRVGEGSKVIFMNAPIIGISSTYIRETVKKGLSIRYLVPDRVYEEIEKSAYYK